MTLVGCAGWTVDTETILAEVLAGIVGSERVSVESNFFDDLGADSLVMAQFCARVRKRADLPSVSMKDIYQHPTIRSLATALADPTPPAYVERGLAEVLADVVGVERVSVDSHFFDDLGADSMVMAQFCARVRKRADLPSVSMKDIYRHPTIRSLATAFADPAPAPVEAVLAEILAGVVGVEQVSVDSHFFDDLGADSMVMAQFCARVRKRDDLPAVSMKDVYRNPTIKGLTTALAPADPVPTAAAPPTETPASPQPEKPRRAGTGEFVLCGALQFLLFLGYASLSGIVFERSFTWISAAGNPLDEYKRAVEAGAVAFVAICVLPILFKWVLIGRWRPQEIRVWSLNYVRFWLVKTLVSANPLVLFAGSPLYSLYLRALGAKVGRRAVIFSRHVPACADLLTVGDDVVIEKDTFLNCYRVVGGVIRTGRVTIGSDVFVGEKAVLDIETSLGDGSQLAHASSLHAGQAVPAGEHWHGSPGEPIRADYRNVRPTHCGTWRRVRYTLLHLLYLLGLGLPLAFGGLALLLTEVPRLGELIEPGPMALLTPVYYLEVLVAATVLYFGGLLVITIAITILPRLLNLALKPDEVYPLYGIRYAFHRTISRMTNRKVFHEMFGDTSYIVQYLQGIGYKLSPVVQTGSNFGTEVKHDNPFLSSVGSGTVVAAGISFVNSNYSSTSFSVSRSSVGPTNFLGNDIVYPPQGRTGANCLLATKVLVPIDGEVREGVGLLGSPSFEIPRTVQRDSKFSDIAHGPNLPQLLAAKNRHNLVSIAYFLLSRWFYTFVILLTLTSAFDIFDTFGAWAVALADVAVVLFTIVYFSMVERASTGFRGVRPKHCSIYDIDFWRTERFFKLCLRSHVHRLLNGTPFKAMAWRMVGVRVGKRLFDDGAGMSEKNIVTIGDDVTLNAGSYIQCHSQEDYAFKSEPTTIGSGCTVGVATMVHYGVTMGDGSTLAPDTFLMKGEEMPPHAHWGGNPAREMRDTTPVIAQRSAPRAAEPVATAPPAALDAEPVAAVPPTRRHPAAVGGALVAVVAAAGMGVATVSGASIPPQPLRASPASPPPAPPAAAPAPPPAAPAPNPEALPAEAPVPPPAPSEMQWFGYADLPRLDAGLQAGSRGEEVVTVQQHLQRLGFYTGPANGQLDGPTEAAVRRFQEASRVTGDPAGTVGRATAVALLAGGEQPVLRPGASGEDVHRLQHALAVALGRALPPSGNFLSMTQQAVRDYHASRGLPGDGTATAATWTALQQGR